MVSYIYSFIRRMAIKLGRVVTYSEGFLSAKPHDCLITWSHGVTWGRVTYCRVISTLYLHRRHMAPIYGRKITLLRIYKKIKAKSNRTVRIRAQLATLHWFTLYASFSWKRRIRVFFFYKFFAWTSILLT